MSVGQVPPNGSILHADSLVLVTGGNGLIGSNICDQLLRHSYRVRATVRSVARTQWLAEYFTQKYGKGRFELFELPNVQASGALDESLEGISAVAHAFSTIPMVIDDVDAAILEEMRVQTLWLDAFKRHPQVVSVAMLASAWGAYSPHPSKHPKLGNDTFNEDAIRIAQDETVPKEEKRLETLMALKAITEKQIWGWVAKENPPFRFNSIRVSTVMGAPLNPKVQGFPSTVGMVTNFLAEGKGDASVLPMLAFQKGMQPLWHVDGADVGRLFVGALSLDSYDRQIIYAFAEKYSWGVVSQLLKEYYPQGNVQAIPDKGEDGAELMSNGEEVLKRLGRDGWVSLKESVKAGGDAWIALFG